MERLIHLAVVNGFTLEHVEILSTISHAYDVWRLKSRDDPPANVPPFNVCLKDGARPTKFKPRKYPPHARQVIYGNLMIVLTGI